MCSNPQFSGILLTLFSTSIELVTTTRTADQAVTVASNTITVTITAPPAPPAVLKRQATGGITQAAQIISQCLEAPRDGNLTVISVASSACSCLFIPTTTVTINTIATSVCVLHCYPRF